MPSPEHKAAMARPVAECVALAMQNSPGILSACRIFCAARIWRV